MAGSTAKRSNESPTKVKYDKDHFEQTNLRLLKEDWPAMPRKNRVFFMGYYPELVEKAGLTLDDPFVWHPDWVDQYDDETESEG